MRGGDGPRQQVQHSEAAENSLADDRPQRDPSQEAHPFAFFDKLRPHSHDDDQEADKFGDHAMSVFILHSANHGRNFVERSERSRPIGH